ELLLYAEQDRGGERQGFEFETPIHLRLAVFVGVLSIKSYIGAKRSPAPVVKKHGEGGASSVLVFL
ncbi:hypothetical protein AVEN_256262-1, partial [Araneus ventricosus]